MIEYVFFVGGGILGWITGIMVGYYLGVLDERKHHVSKYFFFYHKKSNESKDTTRGGST